jgi:hypothetical protein
VALKNVHLVMQTITLVSTAGVKIHCSITSHQ